MEELQGKVDALQAKLDALDAEYAGASPELLASLEKQLADLTKLHAEKLAAYQKADEELKTANERLKRVRKLIEKLGKGAKAKIARRRAVIENAANLYKEFKAEMERAQVEQLKARWRSAPLPKKRSWRSREWRTSSKACNPWPTRAWPGASHKDRPGAPDPVHAGVRSVTAHCLP